MRRILSKYFIWAWFSQKVWTLIGVLRRTLPSKRRQWWVFFLLGVSVHFSPLAAFSCQGSSKNFHYHFWVSLLFQCWHVCPLLVLVCMQVSSSSVCPLIVVKITQKLQKSTKNLILTKTGIPVLDYSLKKIKSDILAIFSFYYLFLNISLDK